MKKGLYEKFFKRFFDCTICLFAFIVISPIFLLLMLLTRIYNGKGVFFKQPRPGKDGKIFTLYKFRSMSNKCDANGNLLPDKDRVTKWGKFLRKTSLDELPQLLNIIKGEMAIVGPRPRLVKDMVFYPQEYFVSYTVRPGLTGNTQANGRNSNTWEQVLEKDRDYSEHITFWGDVKLIFKTFTSIFVSRGAAEGEAENKQAYYYADYLLESNQISFDVYNRGIDIANGLIKEMGQVTFMPELVRLRTNSPIVLPQPQNEQIEQCEQIVTLEENKEQLSAI